MVELAPESSASAAASAYRADGRSARHSASDVREPDAHLRIPIRRRAIDPLLAASPARAAQRLAEQQAQRIQVGAMVDRAGIGSPRLTASSAARCSGAIQPGVPPIRSGNRSPARIGRRARWKSRSMASPSAAIRTFDGFTSMCTRPWRVGLVQGIGQTGADPADRLDVRGLGSM